jgi:hypothetical protein
MQALLSLTDPTEIPLYQLQGDLAGYGSQADRDAELADMQRWLRTDAHREVSAFRAGTLTAAEFDALG